MKDIVYDIAYNVECNIEYMVYLYRVLKQKPWTGNGCHFAAVTQL
jgi:hypothetical protein